MDDVLVPKSSTNFFCKHCDYSGCRESQYLRHCETTKHKRITERLHNGSVSSGHECSCGKVFKFRQGLHKHKITCHTSNKTATTNTENIPPIIDYALVIQLIKQNEKLQDLLLQQAADHNKQQSELINKLAEREPGNTVNSHNTTNNNQKFNLNFFLNETCKDAMNMQEFLANLHVTFDDLLKIGDNGFVSGVSEFLVKELSGLEITKRPIHCTDIKRDTIHLKENDVWTKDEGKLKLKAAIERVEYKNVAALNRWREETPDANINNTPNNLLRDKIFMQTLQGDDNNRSRIIKNLTKAVYLDKE